MSEQVCRWGILSAANIARKNWKSIGNAENCALHGVASRDITRAQQFIDECQAAAPMETPPIAYGSYQELIDSPDVDAVYVPIPTGLRRDWVIKAAEAGKHVMCEKPCAVSYDQLREMTAACEANNVQFMDGVMFMHSQRLAALRETINDGESVGELRRISSQFSFLGDDDFLNENIRLSGALEPDGCVGDLGWYTIRFALWVMNYQMPRQVTGRLLRAAKRPDSENDVPIEFSAELSFDDGVTAGFYCSFVANHQQWAVVSGTKGYVRVDDFVLPYFAPETSFEIVNARFAPYDCDFNMEKHNRTVACDEYASGYPSSQECNLFRNFASSALSGTPDPHWPEIALKTQRVMEAALTSARRDGQLQTLD